MIQKKSYSYPIDWWSFGVLVYEMITGVPPFSDDNRQKLFQIIIEAEPDYESMPPHVIDFIQKFLKPKPEDRATIDDVWTHPFWEGLDLNKVEKMEVKPEWKPIIKDIGEPDNFDDEFTTEDPIDSIATPVKGKEYFAGFSYENARINSPIFASPTIVTEEIV
jgi:serum/glucocorticoid-regulated kinase 2